MGDIVVAIEAVKRQVCALEYASKELMGDSEVIRFSTPPRSSWATGLSQRRLGPEPVRRARRDPSL
eukprot:11685568-Heterocapsa_arctica.AAC.1